MDYRREIDGLRAIAVVPVILFHAGFQTFSGGFVGVDVFFVISGYLITSIILSEKERGTFSLVSFYERRARRILPALYLVMFVSIPFSWLWLWPTDYEDFSQSLIAVPLFSSNILFWQETGYWGIKNELKPLLHTWSLAVEEQYYVLFPLFLMLMWRFRKRWILISIVVIAAASLIASQWGAINRPTAAFFLLPTRGWELAIGASIAFYFIYDNRTINHLLPHRFYHEALGLIGLLMIGYAVFIFDKTVSFPGLNALVPTIGTGLIILFSSSQTLVGRLLSIKYLVGIGLISYSAYLWHQPLFVFARHRSLTEPSELLYLGLSILSIALAYLSWHYVERPFRTKGIFSRKQIFSLAITCSMAFIILGLAGHNTNGFDNRSTSSGLTLEAIDKKRKKNHGFSDACNGLSTFSTDCRTSDEPEIIVWGDSYAMHLVQGILSSKPDAKIIQLTKSNCGPFFNIAPINPSHSAHWANGCLKFTEEVRKWLKANNTVKYAVLSSNFENYLSEGNNVLFRNGDLKSTNFDTALTELKDTLIELKSMGITPVIFSPMPSNGTNLGRCLARAEWLGLKLDECDFQVDKITQNRLKAYSLLDAIKNDYPVVRLDKYICDNARCITHSDAKFIYRDVGHLSHEGSAKIGKDLSFYQLITNPELINSFIDSTTTTKTVEIYK